MKIEIWIFSFFDILVRMLHHCIPIILWKKSFVFFDLLLDRLLSIFYFIHILFYFFLHVHLGLDLLLNLQAQCMPATLNYLGSLSVRTFHLYWFKCLAILANHCVCFTFIILWHIFIYCFCLIDLFLFQIIHIILDLYFQRLLWFF